MGFLERICVIWFGIFLLSACTITQQIENNNAEFPLQHKHNSNTLETHSKLLNDYSSQALKAIDRSEESSSFNSLDSINPEEEEFSKPTSNEVGILIKLEDLNTDPNQFIGQLSAMVSDTLGKPDLVRKDGPAEIWQFQSVYADANCVLDVFLYKKENKESKSLDSNLMEVRFVDLRNNFRKAEFDKTIKQFCFATMLPSS